jgi:DNA-directed RNA polymerase specialized sigma24 family protein
MMPSETGGEEAGLPQRKRRQILAYQGGEKRGHKLRERKGRETRAYEKWWRSEASPVENVEAGALTIKETGTEAGIQPSVEEDVLRGETARELRRCLNLLPKN